MLEKKKRGTIYILGFLLGLHIALPAYITSSFLSESVSLASVGAIFSVGSALSIIALALFPSYLRRFGNFAATNVILGVELAAMLVLAFAKRPLFIVAAEIVSLIAIMLLILSLDIFLEHYSRDMTTGGIRGAYLVSINGAWVVAQLLIAVAVWRDEYSNIFLLAGLVLLPVTFILFRSFRGFSDSNYEGLNPFRSLVAAMRDSDVSGILVINFLLQFFYAWMVIYSPIFLHLTVGFDWKEIGLIFAIMLLPFVLTEYPLGRIADAWIGEKEILIGGFVVMSLTTASMAFISSTGFWTWALILFASRLGASMVEAMSETYFFKHVDDSKVGYISLFRTTRPWAYVLAPALATIVIPFSGLGGSFLILSLITLYGLRFGAALRDTK